MSALSALSLVVVGLAGLPSMDSGPAEVHTGCVVAAPHEGFDDHTAPIARGIAARLGWGWAVAEGFRDRSERRWINVNRPTERPWRGAGFAARIETVRARQVYAAYQKHLDRAAGRAPLELLVEIHGHARRVMVDGERVKLQVIELATRGFDERALRALRSRYRALVAELPEADRVPLAVEQLDRVYRYRGARVEFYFRASGSKRAGSLSPERARRALHFELPQKIRFDPERRAVYTALLARLLSASNGDGDDAD